MNAFLVKSLKLPKKIIIMSHLFEIRIGNDQILLVQSLKPQLRHWNVLLWHFTK